MWHIYYHFHRVPEAEETKTQACEPEWLNSFPDSFWYAKFVPTILAYINLAHLLSIQTIGTSEWLISLSGWKVFCIWGIILALLLVWYAIIDKKKQPSHITCPCVRLIAGIVVAVVSLIILCS